jgi:hypothetical protein
MKTAISLIATMWLAGCATGIDPVDSLFLKDKSCSRSFTVNNQSHQTLNLEFSVIQDVDDARCENQIDDQTSTAAPGATGVVRATLNCRQCAVNESYSITSSDPNVKLDGFNPEETEGDVIATCTDTGCTIP